MIKIAVCDANFNRVKVKSPEYVKAHFIRNNNVVTDEKLIEIILENEIDEFLIYATDFKERLLYLKELKEKCIDEIEENIIKLNPNEFSLRKELAYEINKFKTGYYYLYVVEADSAAVNEFDRVARINESLLRHLVVKVED